MEVVLIRHTRCAASPGTCYGRLDVALAESAREDIERTLARTPRVELVFSSPAQRCHRLALALTERDGCELRVLPELQELHFGAWEGQPWSEIPRSQSDVWALDPWQCAPPGGESERELWARAEQAVTTLNASAGMERVAIVSHAGPLRVLRCLLTGAPRNERWSWNLEQGEIACIPYDS